MVAENGALDVLLFDAEGEELLDIKCFRGDRADVTADDIQGQMHAALMHLKMHPDIASAYAPDSGVKPVEMIEFAKGLLITA